MRLVDADNLNKKKKYSFQTVLGAFPKYEWFIKADDLFSAPTVDAVPVVRCRECEYHSNSAFYHDLVLCTKHGIYMRTDGFCSFGDRKCNTTRKEGADNG